MKTSIFKPFLILAILVLLVSTGCSFGNDKTTQEPIIIVVTATSEAPVEPTAPPATEAPVVATEAPTATEEVVVPTEPSGNFTDEFDSDLSNYLLFQVGESGRYLDTITERAEVEVEDGKAKFKLNGYSIYYYLVYDKISYDDVRIDIEVDNQGTNNNSVSLVCRYDPELGWYEFNITSSGLWNILYYDRMLYKGYKLVANGGSTKVKMGKDTNTYAAVCKGDELSLYINDGLTKTIKHKDLKSGKAGFGISSYDAFPVMMTVPWVKYSIP